MNKLEAIEARLQAATPGPWGVYRDTQGPEVCDCGYGVRVRPEIRELVRKGTEGALVDAALIANAPADLAALLVVAAKVKRLPIPDFVNSRGQLHCAVCGRETILHGHAPDCRWMDVVDAMKPLLEAAP